MSTFRPLLSPLALGLAAVSAWAPVPAAIGVEADPGGEISLVVEVDEAGGDGFAFETVPVAVAGDAAEGEDAAWTLVDGRLDPNGAGPAALGDGRLPASDDDPARSVFFAAGTDGGRLALDLGRRVPVRRVGTYSWHRTTRGPQVYTLWGSTGEGDGFEARPGREDDPESFGWTRIAEVDTRKASEAPDGGGRHGVAIAARDGDLGEFRHLLFDFRRTENRDPFGNTFLSEIDVVAADAPEPKPIVPPEPVVARFATGDGRYSFILEATEAPDLMPWAEEKLKPVVLEWYPKIVAMLPSEGFEALREVRLRFRNDMGGIPASAGGGNVNMNAPWFRRELEREARGAVVHELVHVVQAYPRGLRARGGSRVPGWIVEGIPDYIRWFLYEPETHGAAIPPQRADAARHDASYRVSANFLDWVSRTHGEDTVPQLNAAARQGRWSEDLWKSLTGMTVEELAAEWRKVLAGGGAGDAPGS